MKLSAATKAYERHGRGMPLRDLNEVLLFMRQVGYEAVDLTLETIYRPEFILAGEDWEKKVEHLAETAAKVGMEIYQCHTPNVSAGSLANCAHIKTEEDLAFFREMQRRTVLACAKLGIRWAVYHPLNFPELNFERQASLDGNRAFYDELVELAVQHGVGTAFENQLPFLDRKYPTRFCSHYEELLALVDSYNDPLVGICWDTGHANQMQFDQGRAIRAVGRHLKALHINDNHYGRRDEHLLPYMGEVDWAAVAGALREVGYNGTLNYECKFTMVADGEFQREMIRAMYRNGELLRDMIEHP